VSFRSQVASARQSWAALGNERRQRGIYTPLERMHGNCHLSLHWSTEDAQRRRFEALAAVGRLDGCSVLDIGCGLGDFFSYLDSRGITVQGTGYDILPAFVSWAQENCPDATFAQRNIVRDPPDAMFDYVISSGLYAFGDDAFFMSMTRAAYALARRAYAFNLHETAAASFFNPDRQAVTAFCESLQPAAVRVVDGYMPRDFTVYLRREPAASDDVQAL
jgi:SAM-dependent methyltransferase